MIYVKSYDSIVDMKCFEKVYEAIWNSERMRYLTIIMSISLSGQIYTILIS